MKKFLSFLVVINLSVSLFAATYYDCVIDGIYYKLDKTNKTASVSRKFEDPNKKENAKVYIGSVNIPSQINYKGVDYTVTSIGTYAFIWCDQLTSVTLPHSLTSLEYGAFYDCTRLASIEIPNTVIQIGDFAFNDCKSLRSITIPNSVTDLGEYAFEACDELKSVRLSNNIPVIKRQTFFYCYKLDSIIIPNSVTRIEACAFQRTSLSSIVIPNSVTEIQWGAFQMCTNLTSVELPNSLLEIGHSAFEFCFNLTSITIPASVKQMGFGMFNGCYLLQEVVIASPNIEIENNTKFPCFKACNINNLYCSYSLDVNSLGGTIRHIHRLSNEELALQKPLDIPAPTYFQGDMIGFDILQTNYENTLALIHSFPDENKYTTITRLDSKHNRRITLCPELGRIVIEDGTKDFLYCAFPKAKLAYLYPANHGYNTRRNQNWGIKVPKPLFETEDIDGTLCVPYYQYREYVYTGGVMDDTITINNTLFTKGEQFGWAYANYPLIAYEAYITTPNAITKSQIPILVERDIDETNFELPQDYEVLTTDPQVFCKKIAAIMKKRDLSISVDINNLPDNLWSLVP